MEIEKEDLFYNVLNLVNAVLLNKRYYGKCEGYIQQSFERLRQFLIMMKMTGVINEKDKDILFALTDNSSKKYEPVLFERILQLFQGAEQGKIKIDVEDFLEYALYLVNKVLINKKFVVAKLVTFSIEELICFVMALESIGIINQKQTSVFYVLAADSSEERKRVSLEKLKKLFAEAAGE